MKSALFKAARAAMANSHSPYSKFPVGAAVMTSAGNIYGGCNIENASYPEGWCAETSAISHMVTAGENQIAEICVTAEKMDRITPCGEPAKAGRICRAQHAGSLVGPERYCRNSQAG